MAHSNQNKNISGMSGLSSGPKLIFTGIFKDGNESDDSIGNGNDIQGIKIQTIKFTKETSIRLGENSFGGQDGVWAKVLFGEIFADDNEMVWWDKYPTEVQLRWRYREGTHKMMQNRHVFFDDNGEMHLRNPNSCNTQNSIILQKGFGHNDITFKWSGWDNEKKCYLYRSKYCMRILEIEVPNEKITKKIGSINHKVLKSSDSASDAEEKTETTGCSYIVTKGKEKGNICGKYVSFDGLCKKHDKSTKTKKKHSFSFDALLGQAKENLSPKEFFDALLKHPNPQNVPKRPSTRPSKEAIAKAIQQLTKRKSPTEMPPLERDPADVAAESYVYYDI